jgi:hypothetical protein
VALRTAGEREGAPGDASPIAAPDEGGRDRPIASLSLDLDNLWSYLRTAERPGWDRFPSFLDAVVPRALDFLARRRLTVTVFVVGKDAEIERNREGLASIALAGHEIGNHSFHHQPWLHLYSEGEVEAEIALAEEWIERVCGRRPLGFRAPGYSLAAATLRVLARRGYLYDASVLPTCLGPLARAYYFLRTAMTARERHRRRTLFGSFRDGLRPLKPYHWRLENGRLLEIPVTTMPGLRLPVHASYVLYLSGFSSTLAVGYFDAALRLFRLTGTGPSLLLHPLDFLGREDCPALSFFPTMDQPRERKLELLSQMLALLSERFRVVTLAEHARSLAEAPSRERSP